MRPVLQYSGSVWDPSGVGLQNELEKVQNRAARFVTGNYNFETGSMTGILEHLKWESLKKRRRDSRLILLYKGLKGKDSIPTDDLISLVRRGRNDHWGPPRFFLGAGEKAYFIFREQGEISIILREPGSQLLILGSLGALSKMNMVSLRGGGRGPPPPPLPDTSLRSYLRINPNFKVQKKLQLSMHKYISYVFKLTN